jgi:hypothetical protein
MEWKGSLYTHSYPVGSWHRVAALKSEPLYWYVYIAVSCKEPYAPKSAYISNTRGIFSEFKRK